MKEVRNGPQPVVSATAISDQFLATQPHDGSARPMQAECQFVFASGLLTARTVLMNSSARGLSVLFFNVTIETDPRAFGKSTDKALSGRCLLDGSSTKRGSTVRKR